MYCSQILLYFFLAISSPTSLFCHCLSVINPPLFSHPSPRLEFESQRTCLKAQLEYEQGQLEQQRKKMKKLEETIALEQCRVEEQKQAKHTSSPPFSPFLNFPLMLSPFILLSCPSIPPFLPFSHQLLKSSSKITQNVIPVLCCSLVSPLGGGEAAGGDGRESI